MNTKNIIVAIVVLAIIGGGIYYFTKNSIPDAAPGVQPITSASHETTNPNAQPSGVQSSGTTLPAVATSTPAAKSYTMADVQKHNSRSSCWTAINGNVYDVTSWISQHPGGADAILSLCGKDGTSAFQDQHGGQARPEQELASFKIGALLMGL